jgi:hypothetical protein
MTSRSIIRLRNVGIASASYSATCFAVTSAIYLLVVMTGNADIRDPNSGAPVEALISLHTFFVSSLFVGLATTLFCLGGLAGVWVLAAGPDRKVFPQVLGAALIAAIAAGVFSLGTSLSDNHLVLRSCSIAAISLMIALLVRVYTCTIRVEQKGQV